MFSCKVSCIASVMIVKSVAIKVCNCVTVELGSDETALRIARETPLVKQRGMPVRIDAICKIIKCNITAQSLYCGTPYQCFKSGYYYQ